MVKNTTLSKDMMGVLREDKSLKCFESILSDSTTIAGAGFFLSDTLQTIYDIDPNQRYADEMKSILDEFLQKVK